MYYRNDPSEYSLDFCYSALPLYTSDNQLGACGLHIMNIIMNPPPLPHHQYGHMNICSLTLSFIQ